MILDVGPLLRTVRRQPGVWTLMVLEMAVGVTTIGSLLISGAWYGQNGNQPSGLDEENLILVATYTPSGDGDPSAVERAMLDHQRADRQRVRAVPDVEAATQLTTTIVEDRWSYPSLFAVRAAGSPRAAPPLREGVGWATYGDAASPRALGLRFIAGEAPRGASSGASDGVEADAERPASAVLTRCLAERLFGVAASAIGARLSSSNVDDVPITGVVEDVIMRMPLVPHSRCTAFLLGGAPRDHDARLIVRARPGRRAAVLASLSAIFAGEAPARLAAVRAFDSAESSHHRVANGLVVTLSIFGALVALVALLGALAATSFLVAQRTRQIGIRRALGATRTDIVVYFLLESALGAAMGSVLGVAAIIGLFTLMRQVFHQIQFRPGLVLLALVALWLGSIVATLVPALRAARVSPSVAGRSL